MITRTLILVLAALALVLLGYLVMTTRPKQQTLSEIDATFFDIQAIDTMKYSRDMAREKLNDTTFDAEIEAQTAAIADLGATHIALGTPYDEEFIPFLNRWVAAARRHELKIWYRGNFSGWEEWFDYPRMDRAEHTRQVNDFIRNNPDLFMDGDIFVSCPECENGGPGDPRLTGDVAGHRAFLIEEYRVTKEAFEDLGKEVQANLYSMNGDVAELIMDRATTAALDGVVTIDHYVADHERMITDIERIKQKSGGRIVLGEYGAPIPDIHGDMSPEEQAAWLDEGLKKLLPHHSLIGVNYWVGKGGSTAIWEGDNTRRPAVAILTKYFRPHILSGHVVNPIGRPLEEVTVQSGYAKTTTKNGYFYLPVIDDEMLTFTKPRFQSRTLSAETVDVMSTIELAQLDKSWRDHVNDFVYSLLQR